MQTSDSRRFTASPVESLHVMDESSVGPVDWIVTTAEEASFSYLSLMGVYFPRRAWAAVNMPAVIPNVGLRRD